MRRLSIAVQTSQKGRQQKCRCRTISELENSVLEVNHVTNVTTVLNETAAQVGVLAVLVVPSPQMICSARQDGHIVTGAPCTWWEHGVSTGGLAGRNQDGILS
jgi:hypothetical protein